MTDEQAKENLITAFIPLAEALHALATSNQTAVLAEISALKDEIAKLTAIGVDVENAEAAAVAAKAAAEQASARVNTLTGHVLVVRDNQATILAKLDTLSSLAVALGTTLEEVKASLPVPPVAEPEEPTDPEPEPEPGTNIPMGVNVHEGVEPAYPLSQTERRIQMVAAANIRSYRNDMRHIENTAEVNRLINLCSQYGVILRPMLYPTTEAKAYNYAKLFGDRVKVWEIGNEVNLQGRDGAEGRIDALVATYRGMKRASDEFNLGLKFTINVTSCNPNYASSRCSGDVTGDTWFLDMARARGFLFDYVSFHHYSHFTDTQYWLDLYLGQLRGFAERYNTKIFLNETNAGEVYNGALGSEPIYAQSVRKFLTELNAKYSDVIAEINMYELIDEPHVTVEAEKHFGMFFNIDTPKPVWEVVKEFASQSRAIEEMPGKPQPAPEPTPEPVVVAPLVGVNFAGLGNNPDVDSAYIARMGTHYRSILDKPNVDYITRYKPTNGGKWVARIPYAAERLFSVANGSFTVKTAYLDQIKAVVSALNNAGATVLLDMHNYCRWWIKTPATPISWAQRQQRTVNGVSSDSQWIPIGHKLCPVDYAMLASMYELIAKEFSGYDVMYGLMNEPHGRGALDGGYDVQGQWVANVQQLIDAVRSVDTEHWITVGGNAYSSAKNWRAVSDGLRNVVGEKIMFEAHQYPDEKGNGGGSWKKGIVHSIDPAARVADFYDYRDWLLEVGRPGMIGEYGTPVTYEKWTANSGGTFEYDYTVQGATEYLQLMGDFSTENAMLCCQWLAGPGDADNYANGMDTESTLKANALATVARMGTESAAGFGPFPVQ